MKKLFSMILLLAGVALCASAQSEVWQALWSEGNTTLYFAYSDATLAAGDSYTPEGGGAAVTITNVWNGRANGGISNRSWNSTVRSKVTRVIFQPSFKNFYPDYAHYWFNSCSLLKTVEGTENLNTENLNRMDQMFSGCSSLESFTMTGKNTDKLQTVESMFYGCKALKSVNLSGWTNAGLQYVNNMFYNCEGLETLTLTGFGTAAIKSFSQMFYGCKSLKTLDVSSFDVSNATNLSSMFRECAALESVNTTGWNVASVTNMSNIFAGCAALKSADLSGWKNEVLTDINSAFSGCAALESVDLSGLYTVKLTNTSNLFSGCASLRSVSVSNAWTMGSVGNSANMFGGCTSIVGQDGTTFDASATDKTRAHYGPGGYLRHNAAGDVTIEPQPAAVWCASNGTLYFTWATSLMPAGSTFVTEGGASVTVSDAWYGDLILSKPGNMNTQVWIPAVRATLEHVVIENSFARARPTGVEWWMEGCSKLQDVTGLANLNLESVNSLRRMFSGCVSLQAISLAGLNTSSVTNLYQMFNGCTALKRVDLGSIDLSAVTDFGGMFYGCVALESLDLSAHPNAVATSLNSMFNGCAALRSVDLSGFNTAKLRDTYGMFSGCAALQSASVSNAWSLTAVTSSAYMFNNCTSIVGQDGTTYDAAITDKTRAHYGPGGYLRHNAAGDITIDPVPAVVWCAEDATMYFTWTDRLLPAGSPFVTEDGTTVSVTTAWLGDDVLARPFSSHPYHIWRSTVAGSVRHAVIESKFAQAHPTEVAMWFYGCSKLEDVTGMANLTLDKANSLSSMFYGCESLKSVDLDKLDASTIVNVNAMFQGCKSLESINLSALAAATLTGQAIYDMFNGCASLKSVDVSMLNVSATTAMFRMFKDCAALESVSFGDFSTANQTNMQELFSGCASLTSLELSGFDTRKVRDMTRMFNGCAKLQSVYVGSYWMTGNASSSDMFKGCEAIVGEDGTTYDSSSVDRTRAHYGAGGYLRKGRQTVLDEAVPAVIWCSDNTTLYFTYTKSPVFVGGQFIPDGTDESHTITSMWSDSAVLESGQSSNPAWSSSVRSQAARVVIEPSFATVKPTSLYGWFYSFTKLEQIDGLANLNTAEATTMAWMFANCYALSGLDLSAFNTLQVTNMNDMFVNMTVAELDLSSFMPFAVGYMTEMFSNCASLKTIKVNSFWEIPHSANTKNMFNGCTSIVGQDGTTYNASSVDGTRAHYGAGGYLTLGTDPELADPMPMVLITTDGTAHFVGSMQAYHAGDEYAPEAGGAPKTISIAIIGNDALNYNWWRHIDNWQDNGLDIIKAVVIEPSFATLRPTTLQSYFSDLAAATSITGLQYLNTADVTDMGWLFDGCSSLTELDLSSFETSKVESTYQMFSDCRNLKSIYVSSTWTMANVDDDAFMFDDCVSLVGEDGTGYNEEDINGYRAHYCAGGYLRHGTDRVIDPTPAAAFSFDTNALYFFVTTTPIVHGGAFALPGSDTYRHASRAAMGERVTAGEKGMIPDWLLDGSNFIESVVKKITLAVIDPSFAAVKPTSVAAWFYNCTALRIVDGLEYLDTSEATDMLAMFYKCSNLSSLDLSGFDTHKVTDMNGMFAECTMLESIYVGDNWNTDAVTVSDVMFRNCYSIVGEDGTRYTATSTDVSRAHYGAGGYLRRHHSEYAVTLPPAGFCTFSAGEAVQLPQGLDAYVCTEADPEAAMVAAVKLNGRIVPANTGVLLRGTAKQTYTLTALPAPPQSGEEDLAGVIIDNLLRPAVVPTPVTVGIYDRDDDGQMVMRVCNYVLRNDKFVTVLQMVGGNPDVDGILQPANTAWLALEDVTLASGADTSLSITWSEGGNRFDVNGDGSVDVGDVNAVLTAILGNDTSTRFDINGDGRVDVGDVNAILAEILSM
ncbi:MAG: BspA family leucine-rich repeat surface protein [Muribaculaceae bacterium]|nr:BspA family leucine-rich repeat surface protein [Muribaculaceae bacterium]